MALLSSLTWIQNLSNSLDHIYHLVSPFSLPTLFFDEFALHNEWVCQTIVTRSAGSCAVAEGFGAGGIGNFSVVATVCLVFECTGCSVGALSILTLQITIPVLFYILQRGKFGPHPHFSFVCFSAIAAWGIGVSWGCASTFIVEGDVGTGGIGQSFLDSNV